MYHPTAEAVSLTKLAADGASVVLRCTTSPTKLLQLHAIAKTTNARNDPSPVACDNPVGECAQWRVSCG